MQLIQQVTFWTDGLVLIRRMQGAHSFCNSVGPFPFCLSIPISIVCPHITFLPSRGCNFTQFVIFGVPTLNPITKNDSLLLRQESILGLPILSRMLLPLKPPGTC